MHLRYNMRRCNANSGITVTTMDLKLFTFTKKISKAYQKVASISISVILEHSKF